MRAVLGLVGLSVLFFSTNVLGTDGPVCTDGSVWHHECNRCWCANGLAACTKMGCTGWRDSFPHGGRSNCKDGSRWLKDECNWCDCVDGVAVCTFRGCLPDWALDRGNEVEGEVVTEQSLEPAPAPASTEGECKPTSDAADRWREGCNWCSCTEAAVSRCTRRACSPAIVERLEGTKECEGRPNWRQDCNWCTCDSGRASCTKMLCEAPPEPHGAPALAPRSGAAPVTAVASSGGGSSAPPASDAADEIVCRDSGDRADRWRADCNWCRCLNGKAACTRRGCPPVLRDRLAGTPVCEGTIEWRKDCNWCSCSNGTAACTLKACINRADFTPVGRKPEATPEPETETKPEAEPECVAGSAWTESCNSCRCSGGVGICTRRACIRAEPDTCQEGALWRKDCNWCSCSEGVPACTEKACSADPTEPAPPASLPAPPSLGEEARCANGSRWRKDSCNWCYCAEGRGVCTSKGCLLDAETVEANKLECIEGSSWSDGCNSCFCGNGRAVCGRKACIAGSPRRGEAVAPDMNRPQIQDRPLASISSEALAKSRVRLSMPVDDRACVPGSRVILDGCNWCTCGDRGVFACTLKACFRPRDPSLKMCEEGSRWRKDCNWCNCVKGQALCTLLACLSDEVRRPSSSGVGPVAPPSDPECVDGSRWRDDCNWCSCSDGKASCTLMGCPPDSKSDEPECVPGASFKQDCNWCHCTERGISVCTLMACRPPRPANTEQAPVAAVAIGGRGRSAAALPSHMQCRPGSRFRLQCNTCTCSSEGLKLCTKRLCRPGGNDLSNEPQCEGDALFLDEENCNWCSCHNGIAACTLKLCFSRPAASAYLPQRARTLSAAPEQQGEDTAAAECVEGTSWLEECNRCHCTNGLKTCSRLLCFSQSPPQPDQDRCQLPADSGPCYASFRVYRFNAEKNRCEAFLYGGCDGNGNRFDTPEECQQTCGGDSPVLDSSCDRSQCPEHRQNSYMAVKGCTPVYGEGQCCASSYACQERSLTAGPDKCLYRGVEYSLGDSIPVDDDCSRCTCSRDGAINCASVECPSMFRGREPGCRPLYRPGECCDYSQECSQRVLEPSELPEDSNSTAPAPPTCTAEGKSYLEGDKMEFEEHVCQSCVCGVDYTGPYGPGCKTLNCGYDFRYTDRIARGCVPLFFKQRCCPITFICPGDSRIAEDQSGANPEGASENVCRFGDTVIAAGQLLATKQSKVTCTCNTPPDVTCVQTEN